MARLENSCRDEPLDFRDTLSHALRSGPATAGDRTRFFPVQVSIVAQQPLSDGHQMVTNVRHHIDPCGS